MLVSFHPLLKGDHHLTCAGRLPDEQDRLAIRQASAVLLPQGCYAALYRMARENCPHVFPNYDARFAFPGKAAQTRMFREAGVPCPETVSYPDLQAFQRQHASGLARVPGGYPCVFKFDWGDEGRTVFQLKSPADLETRLQQAADFEVTGQYGFLLQAQLPDPARALRVVKIHHHINAYWRVQQVPDNFAANRAAGACIEAQVSETVRQEAMALVERLCRHTGIDLAGFDLMQAASRDHESGGLSFLEVNYFFGRAGLGGSQAYYRMLFTEVNRWLAERGLGPLGQDTRELMGL